ncbi:MAG: tetratricopeptide repeat protein [Deltaproteobacteria bacterium]|nr:tetratricopeptide repeat protein [Deltaproteobacteria bacterium]
MRREARGRREPRGLRRESPPACCLPPTAFFYRLLPIAYCLLPVFLLSCESELIRQREELIRRQQEEIARLKQESAEMAAAQQREEQKREDCNRAFRDFEKAQAVKKPGEAVTLYRQGLRICPDDDVAHYELGKILQEMGQTQEAQMEFEAALKINPDFRDARRQLEALQRR